MKKTMKTLAALGLVCAMGTVSFAAESVTVTGPTSKEVTASYTAGGEREEHTYSATISWSNERSASYKGATTVYTWNPGEKKYDSKSEGAVTGENATATVKIENYSDAKIYVSTSYVDKSDDIASSVKDADSNLNKRELESYVISRSGTVATCKETAPSVTSAYEIEVTAGYDKIVTDTVIGTITVTLATTNQ